MNLDQSISVLGGNRLAAHVDIGINVQTSVLHHDRVVRDLNDYRAFEWNEFGLFVSFGRRDLARGYIKFTSRGYHFRYLIKILLHHADTAVRDESA